MMDHADRARALFLQGYNCAQAMLCAYSDVTGFDEALSARLASSFGGGMGRLRQVCGAMSAALMVLGLIHGYDDPADPQAKADHYRLVREYADRFETVSGSIICRTLLENAGIDENAPGGEPAARTAEYYARRPCPGIIWRAARLLDDMLAETAPENRA